MPNDQQPTGPSSPDTVSVARESGDGEDAPKPLAPTAFAGWSGGMPIGDSPNYVPSYDPMTSAAGVEEFGQTIRDQSSIQDTRTGEIVHNVDNSVANPIVGSGEATVVSPSATNDSAPSGE